MKYVVDTEHWWIVLLVVLICGAVYSLKRSIIAINAAHEFKQVQQEVAELTKSKIVVGHALHHDFKVSNNHHRV